MKSKFGINGRFLTRSITGVDRYAIEIVKALDQIVPVGLMVIVVPENASLVNQLELDNIELVRYGKFSGHFWEQIEFSRYLSRNDLIGVNLCNTAPIVNPGVVCIHDMAIRANPDFYSSKFVLWYKTLFRFLTNRAKLLVTVSEFSKREIQKYYPDCVDIVVIPNAWQHMQKIISDDGIFNKNQEIEKGNYYYAMSSLAPNKNLKWLVETALANPDETIVIAGGINQKVFGEHQIPVAENVFYVGYVSDGESKSLMMNAKGFLFPTFYEGFGIPPMEALSCGIPVAVSDTEVMHEIYKDTVLYVDQNLPCNNIKKLFMQTHSSSNNVLLNYGWQSSVLRFNSCLKSLCSIK